MRFRISRARVLGLASALVLAVALVLSNTAGLRVSYFSDTAWQTRVSSDIDRHIAGEAVVQDAPVPVGGPFSARWSGYLYVPRTGQYVFSVFAEGTATLAIDRKTVTGVLPLNAGVHPIVISYAHETGRYGIGVRMGLEGQPLEAPRWTNLSPAAHVPAFYIVTTWIVVVAELVLALWIAAGALWVVRLAPRIVSAALAAATIVFVSIVAFDRPQWIRGPAPFPIEWQWEYHEGSAVVGTIWPVLAGALVTALVAYVSFGSRPRNARARAWIAIACAPCAALAFQIGIMHLVQGGAAATLVRETMSAGDNYFYVAVHESAAVPELLSTYVKRMPAFPLHAQTHPPGPVLYYRTILRAFESSPRAADVVVHTLDALGVHRGRLTSPDYPDSPAMVAAAFVGGLGLVLCVSLACWAVAAMVRCAGADLGIAAQVGLLWALCPAAVAFSPQFDQVTTSLVAFCGALACGALRARRRAAFAVCALAGGICAGLALFSSFAAMPMLVAAALLALTLSLTGVTRASTIRVLALGAAAIVGVALVFVGPALAGYDHVSAARFALGLHLDHYTAARNWWTWIRFNLVDFSVFVGWTLLAWGIVSVATQRVSWRRHGPWLTLLVFLAIFDVSGVTRGEIGRLWMPLMPLMYAAIGWATIRSDDAAPASDADPDAAGAERTLVAVLLGACALVVNLYWLF